MAGCGCRPVSARRGAAADGREEGDGEVRNFAAGHGLVKTPLELDYASC
jgi:hypothetical protein